MCHKYKIYNIVALFTCVGASKLAGNSNSVGGPCLF